MQQGCPWRRYIKFFLILCTQHSLKLRSRQHCGRSHYIYTITLFVNWETAMLSTKEGKRMAGCIQWIGILSAHYHHHTSWHSGFCIGIQIPTPTLLHVGMTPSNQHQQSCGENLDLWRIRSLLLIYLFRALDPFCSTNYLKVGVHFEIPSS